MDQIGAGKRRKKGFSFGLFSPTFTWMQQGQEKIPTLSLKFEIIV